MNREDKNYLIYCIIQNRIDFAELKKAQNFSGLRQVFLLFVPCDHCGSAVCCLPSRTLSNRASSGSVAGLMREGVGHSKAVTSSCSFCPHFSARADHVGKPSVEGGGA